jgi:MOSC domain-containing protein YiiM
MDQGSIVSVNVAVPRLVKYRGTQIATGIFKEPVVGRVIVRQLGIDGDGQADLRVHGGQDKAVYIYPFDHYDFWAEQLGRDLAPGQFGENLTTRGLLENEIRVGDELDIGDVVLEVTEPRFPCFKLGIKMGSQRFLRRFLDADRSGFYCRVLQEGTLQAGEAVVVRPRPGESPTITEVYRHYKAK